MGTRLRHRLGYAGLLLVAAAMLAAFGASYEKPRTADARARSLCTINGKRYSPGAVVRDAGGAEQCIDSTWVPKPGE